MAEKSFYEEKKKKQEEIRRIAIEYIEKYKEEKPLIAFGIIRDDIAREIINKYGNKEGRAIISEIISICAEEFKKNYFKKWQ